CSLTQFNDCRAGTMTQRTDADSILRQVAEKYESCRSYRDCGRTDGYIIVDFKTVFRRPQFKFDWTTQSLKGEMTQSIWGSPNGAWLRAADELREYDGIKRAIAGATGISAGTAPTASMLLMPELREGARHLLKFQYEFVRETDCSGVECF